MSTITELSWSSLTPVVNEIKSPNSHFSRTVFGAKETLPTETIEISVLNKDREMAGFVKKNGEALIVTGHTATYQTVMAPEIKIKIPFTPSELLFTRRPGTTIFQQGSGGIKAAIRAHVRRDLEGMIDLITNTEEWMCAQAIQGTITYSVEGGDNFTITYPKPGGHTITLSTFWDDGTPGNVDIDADILSVKRLMADYNMAPVSMYLGEEASNAFMALMVASERLNKLFVATGQLDLNQQFTGEGVIFLGRFMGMNVFEYSRSVTDPSGSSVDMVRTKYAEFLPSPRASDWRMYYGAIADAKTVLGGQPFQGQRFAKSWEEDDPSAIMALVATRPLPVPRRPYNVSMKVVSA